MTSTRPGLPANFKLPVAREDLEDQPADIGDFLDLDYEPIPAEVKAPVTRPTHTTNSSNKSVLGPIGIAASDPPNQTEGLREASPTQPRRRKQINMNTQTQEMLNELLRFIGRYSLEPNPSAAELVDALIAILHESRDALNLNSVPARGGWGTQSAHIFRITLKSEIQRAIAQHHIHRGDVALPVPVKNVGDE